MQIPAAIAVAAAALCISLLFVVARFVFHKRALTARQWRAMAEGSTEALFVLEATAHDGAAPILKLLRYNRVFARQLPDSSSSSDSELIERMFGRRLAQLILASIATGNGHAAEPIEFISEGDALPAVRVSLAPTVERGRKVRFVGSFVPPARDYRKRQQADPQRRSLQPSAVPTPGTFNGSRDPLTGLFDRRALEHALYRIVRRFDAGSPGALLMLDLDHFNAINETMGYTAGDEALVKAVEVCRRSIRSADTVFRLSGDQFVVVLLGAPIEAAREIAERLLAELDSARVRRDEVTSRLTASIGLVPIERTLDADEILRRASTALQLAKKNGRNCVMHLKDSDVDGSAGGSTARWISRLKDALEEDRIGVVFQPIVSVSDGTVFAYECLMRLYEPDGRTITPGEFITAAEEFGLMPEIDLQVMQRVIRVAQQKPDVRFFVNLSAATLGNPRSCDYLIETIQDGGTNARNLYLEITETAAVSDFLETIRRMNLLNEIGCTFALDDFGVGFSSFAYLRDLPARYIKLDGSFVRQVESDWSRRQILQSLISMCHALDKEVIAEWVESRAIHAILKEMGADYGQGFYWSAPVETPMSSEERWSIEEQRESG